MALIDKETIRKEIERRIEKCVKNVKHQPCHRIEELCELLNFIDTLTESAKRGYKDCNGCEYNRTVKDQIGWQFRGCFGGEYKGKPIAEIELCPLKVATLPEQPVEGLEEAAWEYVKKKYGIGEPEKVFENEEIAKDFIAGAEWQKAKMMEKAVGGRYMKADGKVYVESWLLNIDPDSVKAGDGVRLIVIQKEK